MKVLISGSTIKSLQALQNTLLSLSDVTADAVYAVLGRTAWHGRQNIIDVEESEFFFGESIVLLIPKDKGALQRLGITINTDGLLPTLLTSTEDPEE